MKFFSPETFHLGNTGLCCTNCTNYFGSKGRAKKAQYEMGKMYHCTRMTSRCFYKPLKLGATNQLSAGMSKTKRVHIEEEEDNEEDISTATANYSITQCQQCQINQKPISTTITTTSTRN